MLAVLPQSLVDKEGSGRSANSREYVVSRGDHQDGAAENRLPSHQPVVVSMMRVEIRKDGRRWCHVSEEHVDIHHCFPGGEPSHFDESAAFPKRQNLRIYSGE
jgi:hypothetical protein